MKKSISKTEVLVAACNLMLSNGTATTLEVKSELRKQGYEARQSEVSDLMSQLATEEKWDVNPSGKFKIYTPGATTGIASGKPSPSAISSILKKAVSGCWEMNSTTSSKIVYVNGTLSREKARTLYLHEVPGTLWADTRGRKVK